MRSRVRARPRVSSGPPGCAIRIRRVRTRPKERARTRKTESYSPSRPTDMRGPRTGGTTVGAVLALGVDATTERDFNETHDALLAILFAGARRCCSIVAGRIRLGPSNVRWRGVPA